MSNEAPKSEILIGHCDYGRTKGEAVKIDLEAIAKHVLACGTTGSGKSVALKVCAESLLARGIPVVAIDVMGDLAGLTVPAPNREAYLAMKLPEPIGIDANGWEMAANVAARLAGRVHARYLTPCSDAGERLAISPLPQRPGSFEQDLINDPDEVMLQISSAAWGLMGKIGLRQPRDGVGGPQELVRGVLFEAIMEAWKQDICMDGVEGIEQFLEIAEAKFNAQELVGGFEKVKSGLLSLSKGQAARWLEGVRINWDDLFQVPNGKTPLIIIALEHTPKEQHPWVVSQVVNSLASWCSVKPPTPGRPRVALLIDELAGEGGKNSLLPHLNFVSASGAAIRHVLRKGRHWGLGLVAGTQSPSDIDGKSIGMFNTVLAGRLKTAHDVRLALSGGQMNEDRLKKLSGYVMSCSAPRMFLTLPNGWCESINVRWLGTLHSRIERQHLPMLYDRGILHRSTVKAGGWSFVDQVLQDEHRRTVIFLVRHQDQLVAGFVDSAATGALTKEFPWTVEGLLRASCWFAHEVGKRPVHFLTRSAEERAAIQGFATKCQVPLLGAGEIPWSLLPSPASSGKSVVVAVHTTIRGQGALKSLAARSEAA